MSWGSSLLSALSSLIDLKSIVDFQFVQLFGVVRTGTAALKAFTCRARNQESAILNVLIFFFFLLISIIECFVYMGVFTK